MLKMASYIRDRLTHISSAQDTVMMVLKEVVDWSYSHFAAKLTKSIILVPVLLKS